MIEFFKNWISSILCIGIFITLLELIMPKTKMKKYIYSLVGIIVTITIMLPGLNLLNNDNISQTVTSVLNNFSTSDNTSVNKELGEDIIREEFLNKLRNNIEEKLAIKGINTREIYIDLSDDYNIEKIEVKIGKLNNSSMTDLNEVVKYINEQYDIDYSKISIIESGD